MTRRAAWTAVAATATALMLAPIVAPPRPALLWNATASTPVGLYWLQAPGAPQDGELVAAMPPAPIASYLAHGGFLPRGVPLLKHIAALPGQTVCRSGDAITIDDKAAGLALDRDHLGRLLPRWTGCRRLGRGEVFLMNTTVWDSLDGRYFGPLPVTSVIGRAVPLWIEQRRAAWRTSNFITSRKAIPMTQIGVFTREADGYTGHVHTTTLDIELAIVPATNSDAPNAPDYRIHLGDEDGPEIGAAWKQTGEKAGEYLSILIDDPAFPQPIRANLFKSGRDGSAYHLLWNRPPKRGERE